MKYFLVPFFLISSYTASSQEFGGINPKLKWYQVNTPQAKIIFPKGLDSQAMHIANTIAHAASQTTTTIGGKTRKWNIVLQTQTTIPNAYVRMGPLRSELFMVPDPDNITSGSLRWDELLTNHEYRHIQQFSNFNNGLAKLFTFFLGQEGQLLANGMTIPDYFFEGDAVFQETLLSGQGRGRLPSFFSGMKALWQDDKKYNWMKMRNGSLKHFVPGHYELGYQVVAYGYEKYGADFWKNVTRDASAFKGLFYSWQQAIEKYSKKAYKEFTKEALAYFKPLGKNKFLEEISFNSPKTKTVTNYHFPQYTADGSIISLKESYKQIPTFVIIKNNAEKKIHTRNISLTNYFSYNNGKIVYSSYQLHERWQWTDYSVINILDINTGEQKQLTRKSRYFNPDISEDGKTVLAVNVKANGSNNIDLIDAVTGAVLRSVPNEKNYFFTQTKFTGSNTAVAIVRNVFGQNALMQVNLETGKCDNLTPFGSNAMGYPTVNKNIVYFTLAINNSDCIAALDLNTKKKYLLTKNENSVFYPAANDNSIIFSVVTTSGYRLATKNADVSTWQEMSEADFDKTPVTFAANALEDNLSSKTRKLPTTYSVTPYKKGLRLFNFHSRRPAVDGNEYSYSFLSDDIMNSLTSDLTYTYNTDENSHTIGFSGTYGGYFPFINAGISSTYNRNFIINNTPVTFNTAKVFAGLSIPLQFVTGKNIGSVQFGGNFNAEQIFAQPNVKLMDRKSFDYMNYFLRFSNQSQQARQHIFPRWAQTASISFRDAMNVRDNKKLVINSSFYFPGFFRTHNIVINASFQKRDTLPDLFSRTFAFSRGFEALNTRKMYKLGANYHFPLLYPDFGIGHIAYLQRIRANAFYDYTRIRARVNGVLTDFNARSAGGEVFLDGKIWNSFPVNIGFRISHLLDTDLLSPATKNRFEIILPIGLVPR